MIENIAIILLVFLGQVNVISDVHEGPELLTQFIKTEFVKQDVNYKKSNWDYYYDNLYLENSLYSLPRKIDSDANIDINSKSAIAFDVETDFILYSKNSEKKLPIASLTKIMTALIVLENNKLDEVITISENAFKVKGKKERLTIGEKISVENLLKIMLMSSNNIAAVALAERTSGNIDDFIDLMNKKAKLLGLRDTVFYNPTGLDQESDNISTAYDIAQLVDYSLDKPLIWEYSKIQNIILSSLDGKINHKIKNTNLLLGKFENITGGKTGFTDKAGECLVLIINDANGKKNQIITVVLNAKDRFQETEDLVNWVYKNYDW
ncbi:MAG: D-alanyl-D-alanine carboxypeptidase [Candidatus Pacebacteria bacterium]|nr:D-alanyl-D-alanine carboxypeptidase [Candidatus Paceibacterota bacterium]